MMTTMTVREAILFSARLRLPASISLADKKLRVDQVLKTLRLFGYQGWLVPGHARFRAYRGTTGWMR